ncbi:pyrroline-5-carboxylate reductase [Neisseria shayeganii]|uniref:Pyrroline-5-carboxylate reductase n=1 Tax=Neisseria shayeganii 871 TaxID=1032488 RepID=G4CHN2_9NEIS|nr:pyrroline-5-carboxylate reductase [Neisseria shayeganii]EGY52697.1 pyrroline-5-carboxylate reductase [Neisseria shayeganii 871]
MSIYFLGAGNMAAAIIAGLCRGGGFDICAVDHNSAKLADLAARYGIRTDTALPALGSEDVLVLAVKPQDMQSAAAGLAVGGALVLSVAAGLSCDTLSAWLGGTRRLVRVMPNTPAQVGQGVSGLFADEDASAEDRALAESIMAASGQTVWLPDEDGLHRITGISGSGPAYVFYLMNALAQAAQGQGFSAAEARSLSLATFKGAVALAEESGEEFAVLQQKVTSKGGTTYEALSTFERLQVASAIQAGVEACVARSEELGRQLAVKESL